MRPEPLTPEFESEFAQELLQVGAQSGSTPRLIRRLFRGSTTRGYFRRRFLDVKSLMDVFQQKHDILRKLVGLQQKNRGFCFLSSSELNAFRELVKDSRLTGASSEVTRRCAPDSQAGLQPRVRLPQGRLLRPT